MDGNNRRGECEIDGPRERVWTVEKDVASPELVNEQRLRPEKTTEPFYARCSDVPFEFFVVRREEGVELFLREVVSHHPPQQEGCPY